MPARVEQENSQNNQPSHWLGSVLDQWGPDMLADQLEMTLNYVNRDQFGHQAFPISKEKILALLRTDAKQPWFQADHLLSSFELAILDVAQYLPIDSNSKENIQKQANELREDIDAKLVQNHKPNLFESAFHSVLSRINQVKEERSANKALNLEVNRQQRLFEDW